jgi:tetratricopeptide (TPR) repeat protein
MNECKYAIAENYQAEGSYDEAILMYEEIADYSDSATRILECKYAIAADLQAKEDYITAIEKYSEIKGYNDVAVQICTCNYKLGMIEYNKEQYSSALEYFELAKGVDDTEDMINACKYIIAVDLMDGRAFEDAITYFEQIPAYEDAKTLKEQCEYNLTVDGQFILALSDGLNSRWDATRTESEEDESNYVANLRNLIQCEYEYLEPFKELVFEDEELAAMAVSYIGYLEESNTALDYYNVDIATYSDRWDEAYNGRTLLIRSFAENYDLQISEANQSTLNEFIAGASALDEEASVEEEISAMLDVAMDTLTLESNDYGYRTYSIKVTNTTEKTFAYFDIQAKIYKDGIVYETLYGGTVSDFAPGQTVRFELYADYAIDYYDLYASYSY